MAVMAANRACPLTCNRKRSIWILEVVLKRQRASFVTAMGFERPTWEDYHLAINITGAFSVAGSIFILLSIATLPSVRDR
jgi:hypothetical protein